VVKDNPCKGAQDDLYNDDDDDDDDEFICPM
jgi:hypothetical protein